MTKISELQSQFTALKGTVDKIKTETQTTLDKVKTLEQQLTDADVPQEVMDAFNELKASVTAVDELIPDVTPPVEEESTL